MKKAATVMVFLMLSVCTVRADTLMHEIQKPGTRLKPIDITSTQLEANLKSHIVIFTGNVVAKQGNVVLYCNTLTAYYDEKAKNITKIVATGDVKITRKDMIATGSEAVFDNVNKLLTLSGAPRIWQAKNIIEGTKIVFYLGTDKIFVESAKSLYSPGTMEPPLRKD
ncbi:MAG: lipopolysaccharide transport periplasmic protein LptA [Deltaproteobacteria bacterium]|nr:lipopolysaccharide transport periplasmic protein LptA [Deltaproteobacteria bacterium]MCL5277059.1 lipopolysaccharide transport periplasmic protein LptA [Deltaproteobacteria bacterium]